MKENRQLNGKYKKIIHLWFNILWFFICLGFIGFSCLGFGFHSVANAAVYQCVNESGQIEFRDKPCQNSLEAQTVLSIQSQKTDAKQVKQQEKEIKKVDKTLAKTEKKNLKLQERALKLQEKEKQKQEKKAIRCGKLDEKIKTLEAHLRAGGKMKRQIRLKEELAHAENMRRKYACE